MAKNFLYDLISEIFIFPVYMILFLNLELTCHLTSVSRRIYSGTPPGGNPPDAASVGREST